MTAARLSFPFLAPLMLLGACMLAPNWQAPHFQDHPLAGHIWHVTEGRFITRPELFAALTPADYVLLGETHDNPDHHLLQAEIITAMADMGRWPAVAFEMLDRSQTPALEAHLTQFPNHAAGIAKAVEWGKSGWPDWAIYQPVAEATLRAGLTIQAASMSSTDARVLGQLGPGGALPKRFQSLRLDHPLPATLEHSLRQEIEDAHCGYAPKDMISAMAFTQFSRDAHIAYRMSDSGNKDGAILIAGAGHTRKDRGVPFHLDRMVPGRDIVSLAFIEVLKDKDTTLPYSEHFGGNTLPFDFVWFTPRVDVQDACERFENQLKKMKKRD